MSKWVLAFRRLAQPTTGVQPKLMRQLYIAVAVPKIAYVVDMWYTPVSKMCSRQRLSRSVSITAKLATVQRMATIAITGAL